MSKNILIQALRENNSKTKYFDYNTSTISYKTGFPILDYYLGYKVNVYDENNDIIDSYPSIGISAGCYVTFIGKPSTGKTTAAVQIASNIVRNFDNGTVLHYDLEQAQNYTRIQTLSKFNMHDMKNGKYILRQERNSLNDIKASIIQIYKEKISNPDKYKYFTGKKNEFNDDIWLYEPTVVIIDSIPLISTDININDKKEMLKIEEVTSQTDRMRLTAEVGRFYNELTPYIKEANIIVISINQIKVNPGVGIVKSPSEMLYLKQDEALPGGKTPQYIANVFIKFIALGSEKYTFEEHGFDGFGVKLDIIKSRTNQAGQSVSLIYDKLRGLDSLRSSVEYAKDLGMVSGNKNGYYFIENKDQKFTLKNMHDDFKNNRELYKIMYNNIIPCLEERLSTLMPEEMAVPDEELDY